MKEKDFEFKDLVKVENNQAVTDSRNVAEHFGKLHKNVIQAIENLFKSATEKDRLKIKPMFLESTKLDSYGRNQKIYLMNKKGFSLLVMGFTGEKALEWKIKYIEAFEWMEEQLKKLSQPNVDELVNNPDLLISLATKLKEQKKQIEVLTPKAEYTDHILNSKLLVNTTSIAKDFGMSAVTFNKLLNHFKIIYRHNNRGQWFVYQKYIDKGYAQSCTCKKTLNDGSTKEVIYTKWTQAGKEFICDLLKEHKFIPVVDWAEYPAFYAKELKNRLKELGVLK